MSGHKVFLQDGGDVRDELKCSYCKLVLRDAVQTSETGQRFCKECFDKAKKDPNYAGELDPDDEIWPDFAVKREITNLKVKCENYIAGCNWKGLFKLLEQHMQECQYIESECVCGKQVLLLNMETHLMEECPQRRVKCKDCGLEMYFTELQDHSGVCPNAPRVCENCRKEVPASQLTQHMISECKYVRCICKDKDNVFEASSAKFLNHLKEPDKFAYHLEPIICGFSKMIEAVKDMDLVCRQAMRRVEVLERKNVALEEGLTKANKKIILVESNYEELKKENETIKKIVETFQVKYNQLSQEVSQFPETVDKKLFSVVSAPKDPASSAETSFQQLEQQFNQRISILEKHWRSLNDEITSTKSVAENDKFRVWDEIDKLKHQYNSTVSMPSSKVPDFSSEVLPYEKPSSGSVKQLEEKVLEVERTLNVISVHHSELELQLQASLASTHNGAFLWRIPEVRRRIRDAKIGRITSIYSPPFYTGRNGYKMCIRAYLNGDGTGEGTHLSIFFVLMRGEYDPLLQWPFEPKVSLILVDQDHMKHLVQTFKPNPQSSSFQKPKTDMNVASGCPEFAELSTLENPSYVKDDVMYIKAIVDTSKIFNP